MRFYPAGYRQTTVDWMWDRMWNELNGIDRDIFRLALSLARPIRIKDVVEDFGLGVRSATTYRKALVQRGWLQPTTTKTRIHKYRVHPGEADTQF